jgi:RNA polymerase sigma-70 factor (ECF subfamily)
MLILLPELKQLLATHGGALLLYARQWHRDPDDALQEALVDLLRLDAAPDHPVAWLFTTIRRRAMNLARAEQRRDRHQREAAAQRPAWFVEQREAPFEPGELEGWLQVLPQLEREIVVAHVWGGLTFQQIAELVDSTASTAHRKYQRALERLRTCSEVARGEP